MQEVTVYCILCEEESEVKVMGVYTDEQTVQYRWWLKGYE